MQFLIISSETIPERVAACTMILAAKRARNIIAGEPPLDASDNREKPVSVAAREIANEWITYRREEEE